MEARGSQLETGSVVAGYRIDEMISRGGMGVVYRVTNVALNRIYALKIVAPELADDDLFKQRFRREMQIAASLHHPNVVGIHYAGEHEGMLFLVMDYIPGTDLRQVIRTYGRLEPDRATGLLTQVASALDAAHRRGLVHRDIKPANILIAVIEAEERAYLTDFGVAKRFDAGETIVGLTKTGAVVGTVDYMSPEQITGGPVDARADIYSLGCVFFKMLTGEVPYERDNTLATLYAHVHEPPPALGGPLGELYPTFGAVLDRAMANDPNERYLSAGDFARDASAALRGSRYTGPEMLIATGEARPILQENVADHTALVAAGTQRAEDATVVHAGAEPAPSAQRADPTVAAVGPPSPPAGGRRRYRWLSLAGLVVACGAIAAAIVLSSGSSQSGRSGTEFSTLLRMVPTNRVTGSGTATIELRPERIATVVVDTNGLISAPHLMHIHGGTGNCPTPSDARLYNGHLAIGGDVGNRVYGPVIASLTVHGSTDPAVHLVASLYPAVGNIRYRRTFQLPEGAAKLIKQGLAVVVVHGIDYDGSGRYDNILGTGADGAPVEQKAPALCGPLVPAQTATTGQAFSGAIYTATLRFSGALHPRAIRAVPAVPQSFRRP